MHSLATHTCLPSVCTADSAVCVVQACKQHAAFLSHYKAEAGSDARYLNDLLERMLQCTVFLDSKERGPRATYSALPTLLAPDSVHRVRVPGPD